MRARRRHLGRVATAAPVLALSIGLPATGQADEQPFETEVRIDFKHPCPPEGLVHEEVDEVGNRLEVRCIHGMYRGTIAHADGGTSFIGGCPVRLGVNELSKKVVMRPKGTTPSTWGEHEIVYTIWKNYEPPLPRPHGLDAGGPPKRARDVRFYFDVKRRKLLRVYTTHIGQWLLPRNGQEPYLWWPDGSTATPEGDATTISPLDPAGLSYDEHPVRPGGDAASSGGDGGDGDDAGLGEGGEMRGLEPHYFMRTPAPINVGDGAFVYTRDREDAEWRSEAIEPRVGEPFAFDVEVDGEGMGVLAYELAEGPSGMTIDRGSGRMAWTPTAAQVGPQSVAIRILLDGEQLDVDRFVLTVKGLGEPGSGGAMSLLGRIVAAAVALVLLAAIALRLRRRAKS